MQNLHILLNHNLLVELFQHSVQSIIMNQNIQHRNKCQACFKQIGKFILDCYCFLCLDCFKKEKNKNSKGCSICFKPTIGKFIDTRDQKSMNNVNYLFGNVQSLLNKCANLYKFQSEIDLRYCRYLESQLSKYKELLNELISQNPRLKDYVNNFFKRKAVPSKSLPDRSMPNKYQHNRMERNQSCDSKSSTSIQAQHQRLIDPQRVKGEKNYSANMGYKIPNINYNTALRSSKRPQYTGNNQNFDYYDV